MRTRASVAKGLDKSNGEKNSGHRKELVPTTQQWVCATRPLGAAAGEGKLPRAGAPPPGASAHHHPLPGATSIPARPRPLGSFFPSSSRSFLE